MVLSRREASENFARDAADAVPGRVGRFDPGRVDEGTMPCPVRQLAQVVAWRSLRCNRRCRRLLADVGRME